MSATAAAEIAEYEYQLEQISGALDADPENDELLTLKNELQDLIRLTRSQLPVVSESPAVVPAAAFEKKRRLDTVEARKVGDQVLAKWITGDHQFYAARITSITGNQADPIYTVKFLEYSEVQTLHAHQLRSLNDHKKRMADGSWKKSLAPPTATGAPPPPSQPGLLPHPPPPPPLSDGSLPAAKKKSTLKEDLSQNANSWNSFAKSGPKTKNKVGKKRAIGESSMFRTDENGRVGVIGSGRTMTSDPGKRGRHVFQPDT